MYLDLSFGTYSPMFLLLQSYTVFLLLYNGSVPNLIFVSSLLDFGSYSLTPH